MPMQIFESIIYFIISLLASTIGAICGIGGGVIVKPVLDMFSNESVATISFMSGCMVLAMSMYSVLRSFAAGERHVSHRTGTPLAAGAALGGIIGKTLFEMIRSASQNPGRVGVIQSICLGIITFLTLLYTLNKSKINTLEIDNLFVSITIGFVLGVLSSFLGIGGGPINLVVLFFFYSMSTKQAAANSLYIILFSQATSLMYSIISASVPEFSISAIALLVVEGILGGIIGKIINKRIDASTVDKLFAGLMVVIILISIYNCFRYSGLV